MFNGGLMPYAVPLLAAMAFAGAIYALVYPYISADRQKDKRLEGVKGGGARKFPGAVEAQSSRKKSVADTLREMEDRQKANQNVTMGLRLERAGLKQTPRDFYIASAVLGVVFAAVSLFVLGLPLIGASSSSAVPSTRRPEISYPAARAM